MENLPAEVLKKEDIENCFNVNSKCTMLKLKKYIANIAPGWIWTHNLLAKPPQVSQSRFNPKSAPRKDLGAVLKPNIEPKLDEYHLYFF